jgi:glucose repression regulatory protein TUP1
MSMYNAHRGMGPVSGSARLNELLDGIRQEFETQARASGDYEHSSEFPISDEACTISMQLRVA